jgi:hypothetical protein
MKTKKTPKIQYGIKITKPHSKEMYAHNDKVSEQMKNNILKKWKNLINDLWHPNASYDDWTLIDSSSDIVKLQKGICYSGFGMGYTLGMVDEEFRSEVDCLPNYQLNEEYDYLVEEGLLPELLDEEGRKIGLVGFNS